jgi:protein-L-isoaspartate(D-aspartate) O-methyltransferase
LFAQVNADVFEASRRAGYVMELRRRGVQERRVLAALERVPRDRFVPEELSEFAYADRALPIPCGQTIDRPSFAGRVLAALAIESGHRVLEIGTGSGWLTAALALLGDQVLSLERYRTLAETARARLAALSLDAVEIRCADGLGDLSACGVFDRIVSTAAVAEVPKGWRDALRPGGVLVVPVGRGGGGQDLMHFARGPLGVSETRIGPARCVHLTSGIARAL